MATFTITTAVNIDTLAAKVGSDVYNINGGYLTIDQHTRYGTNQNTSAAMGNLTLSATLGGTVEFNSTKVRLIPYNTGTGNVPALGTTISRTGASGNLLGVYASLTVAPTTAGAAMPATGFILIRQWNSVSYTAGALTGISATATAADGPGWLEIVGVDALSQITPRLGLYKIRGDYYTFQGVTTSGNRATQYQIPSNGSLVYLPGVEVESAPGSGIYQCYPNAGSTPALIASIATDEIRGRWCWISTAGAVTFGNDGTNNTGGFIPESGRKIRIPNLFFMSCISAALTVNSAPNSTLASRMEFSTTSAGVLDFDTCCMNWWMNFSQSYSVKLTNVLTFDNITFSECATYATWNNVGVGQSALLANIGFTMGLNFSGGTLTDLTITRSVQSSAGHYIASFTDTSGFIFNNPRFHTLANRTNANTGSSTLTRLSLSRFNGGVFSGKTIMTTSSDLIFLGQTYYDNPHSNTNSTNAAYMWELTSNCSRITMKTPNFGGLYLTQPYNGMVLCGASGNKTIKLRELGTYNSPLDLGAPRVDDSSWTRVTTVATVTSTAHGLITNDTVYVVVSSVVAAIIIGTKTVTGATANTFTFACLNAGSTSGTISYFPTKCGNLIVFPNGAAADDVRIQRCYVPHTRTNLYTADNSSKNILFENVISDFLNAFTTNLIDAKYKGVSGTPPLTSQLSVYGTHWMDVYNADVTMNLSNQSWTRSGSVITITSADHKLRTGLLVNINISDDIAAVPLGIKSVTVITSSTFTFTGVAAGATSGVLTFRTVIDRLVLMMNEATIESAESYTDVVGAAAFTSAGGLSMPNVDDSITFKMTHYRLGNTGFPIAELVMAGSTLTRYTILYKLDLNDGNGDGPWHNAYYERSGGSGTIGQFTFTVSDATGVEIGDYAFGTGISGNAKVTGIISNTITVDIVNIATVSGTIRFNHLASENGTLTSSGIKLTLKLTTIVANTSAITSITIYTDTDDTSRALQYDLDPVTIVITALDISTGLPVEGARVYLVAAAGGDLSPGTVILSGLTNASGVFADYSFAFTNNQPVTGRVRKSTSVPLYKTSPVLGSITEDGLSLTTFLIPDA